MTLESLGDILKKSSKGVSYNRIYRAHQLQDKISELLGQPITISLTSKAVKIWCSTEQLSTLANLKKSKILALCYRTLSQSDIKIQILVKR